MRRHLPILIAGIVLGPSLTQAADCKQILGTHGFKAAAQVSCGFGQRNNQLLDWARSCARKQDPGVNVAEIRMGANVFQLTEARMGHEAVCQDVYSSRDIRCGGRSL